MSNIFLCLFINVLRIEKLKKKTIISISEKNGLKRRTIENSEKKERNQIGYTLEKIRNMYYEIMHKGVIKMFSFR